MRPILGRGGKVDPAAAAAEAGLVREDPRLGEFAGADEGDVDAAGGHAFALPIEAIAHGGFRVDVQGRERGDLFPIGESDGPERFGVMGDVDLITGLPFRHDYDLALTDLVGLGVEAGGKEEKR